MAKKLVGTVVKIRGKEASVRAETSLGPRSFDCYLRGRLFEGTKQGMRNQVAVGDRVELDPLVALEEHGPTETVRGVIHEVLDRNTVLVRLAGRRKPTLQVLAANVDQIVIVSALERPRYKTGLVDRYLAIAHQAGIAPALCLNKMDLGTPSKRKRAEKELALYRELGYPLVLTSVKKNLGLEELRALLKGKRSVLVGHSGVGKSKLAAAVQPGLTLQSAGVDRRGRGRHTTTASTLFELDFGGELVDTPGVRELSIRHIERSELPACFIELRPFLGRCHFSSCSHLSEPQCAVRQALEQGKIASQRYESYRRLYEELA